jgi:non-ribosomal peptide synthase protein (TIGR01720 family)
LGSGKVDRRGLPKPEGVRLDGGEAYAAPRTEAEAKLAEIWGQVLGVERVGVNDNFFELGGDSILSIQVIARANRAGLRLTPRQMFEAQTIAELGRVVGRAEEVEAEQGLVEGEVKLSPVQKRFFERELEEAWHWNQSVMLEVDERLEGEGLRAVVGALLRQHDALRMRYESDGGRWRQRNAGEEGVGEEEVVAVVKARREEVERLAGEEQGKLDIGKGPLLRVVYYEGEAGEAGYLLMVVHHLVMDGVSWRILVEDFWRGYGQWKEGQVIELGRKSSSYREWVEGLERYAQSEAVERDGEYWQGEVERMEGLELPVDKAGGENLEGSVGRVRVSLGEEQTRALVQEVPGVYGMEVREVLLAGLAQAVGEWSGSERVVVEMEGHGREDVLDGVDVTRTVGWFTSVYPVRLEVGHGKGAGEVLKAVKEQVRGVPGRGMSYGLLRYMGREPELREKLSRMPVAPLSFNYLGQFDQALSSAVGFRPAQLSTGFNHSPRARREHLIDVAGSIFESKLCLELAYSSSLHHQATIQNLARAYIRCLGQLIQHCLSPEAGGYTPSDFKDVQLTEEDIGIILDETQ